MIIKSFVRNAKESFVRNIRKHVHSYIRQPTGFSNPMPALVSATRSLRKDTSRC